MEMRTRLDFDQSVLTAAEEISFFAVRWVGNYSIYLCKFYLFERRPVAPDFLGSVDDVVVLSTYDRKLRK